MSSGSLSDALRETLVAFDEPGVPRTTTEVAERLDLGRRSTYARLERLVELDRLETKKVGANARVWWRTPAAARGHDAGRTRPRVVRNVPGVVYRRRNEPGRPMTFVAGAVTDVTGYDPATMESGDVDWEADVVHPDDGARVREEVRAQLDEGTGYTVEYRIRTAGGETRWVRERGRAVVEGGTRVLDGVIIDVTEEGTRGERYQQFRSLVEATEEYAIFMLDPDGYVRTWNPGARRIKGYESDDIVGEHFSTFYTEGDRAAEVPRENLAVAAEEGSVEDEGWRVRADGSRFWGHVTITAIRDDGDLQGYAKVTRDMTDRREYERRLRDERDVTRQVLDAAPASIFVLDSAGEITRANDRLRRQLGTNEVAGELSVGDVDVYDESGALVPPDERPYRTVFDTGEAVTDWQCQVELPSGERRWMSLDVAPITYETDDAMRVVVAAQDVTKLREQERRLKRQRDELRTELDDVFARIDDGFYALDEELRFVHVNERAETVLDRSAGELVGEHVGDALEPGPEATAAFDEALETGEAVSFEEYHAPLGRWFENHVYPAENGLSVYFRDVTERKERKRELERYETIVETVQDGIYVVDEDGCFTQVNAAYRSMTGRSREELLGAHVSEVVDDDILEEAKRLERELVDGERTTATLEAELTTPDGETRVGEATFALMDDGDDGYERIGVVRDVTERERRERALEESRRRYRTLVENFPNGAVLLFDEDLRYLTVGGEIPSGLGITAEAMEGAAMADVLPEEILDRLEPRYRAVFDGEACEFELELEHRVRHIRAFPVHDGSGEVFAGMAMSQDVTRQRERENELERQREQLAALNSLNEIVREITGAVIDQSTREEIEETVCERLAESDSYRFAWIGDADPATRTVNVRTEAGVEGYLDGITIPVDPDDDRSERPTGRALRTGETQTTQNLDSDRHGPDRDGVERYGFRSSAAVPVVHEGTTYGVLNVYADRPNAFEGEEREVVEQLGGVVGHAIAAAERKQALLSDEVVELEFYIGDVFRSLGIQNGVDDPIRLEHTILLGEDDYIFYGRTTPAGVETVEAMVDAVPFYEDVTFHDDGDERRFELPVSDPPVLSVIASLGGSVEEAIIEDGDYRLTVHLSPSADVRHLIDAVTEAYPRATLLRRQQLTKHDRDVDPGVEAITAELTDRQRVTLEAAYHAGFFEWPRGATGEDVAASIGVAPSTFHQHLRKGQRKVFDAVFSPALRSVA